MKRKLKKKKKENKENVWDTCCSGLLWWFSGQKGSRAWAFSQVILLRFMCVCFFGGYLSHFLNLFQFSLMYKNKSFKLSFVLDRYAHLILHFFNEYIWFFIFHIVETKICLLPFVILTDNWDVMWHTLYIVFVIFHYHVICFKRHQCEIQI